ncbi:MAG: SusF/SusE family outer membrane protein, partial [Paludibacteraceae bacterium]|nr:SusF/SusE family outer membrane protein [Paludibacteraceae bacterium]
ILVRCESGCGEESYWNVPNTAFYTLDVDMTTLTMNISVSDIENVWMIGDATAGGWSWDKVTLMNRVSDGVFTFTGSLVAGQIKFPLEIRTDWAGFFIVATANGTPAKGKTPINIVSNIPADESLDRKWKVESPGTYTITINLSEMTVEFEQ